MTKLRHFQSPRPAGDTPTRDETPDNPATQTVLSNERTYAAWLRTGLAALATGLGIEKFMIDVLPSWSVRMVATLLLLFSAFSFLLASWRYTHLHLKMTHVEVDAIPLIVVRALSICLAGCAILALVSLWLLA